MTVSHVVHVAPASSDRLKKAAYARLSSTAQSIRLGCLTRMFLRLNVQMDDLIIIKGKNCTPNAETGVSDDVIAELTHRVRLLSSLWGTERPGRKDHDPAELARKVSDYLDVDTQIGSRLQRWASYHAGRNLGPPAFDKLDAASKELLRMGSGPLSLVGPKTAHAVDELIARIHKHAPWHSHATTLIWHHLRASRKRGCVGLSVPPLLLYGPPGTGKSTLARTIAQDAKAPYIELDVGAGTAAFRIAGVEAGWSTRQIGDVVRLVCESRTANPIIILNEIDKVGRGATSGSGTRTSMLDALLPLLERGTAKQFRCPASGLDHDLSRVNWILTANQVDHIDPVLRSRLEPIQVPALSRCDLDLYIDLAIPAEDRDVVRHILEGLAPSAQLTLRHISRLADRLRGSEPDHFLN